MENTGSLPCKAIPLGKSDGTSLNDHRAAALKVFRRLKVDNQALIEVILQNFNIDTKEFWLQLSFLVSHHDFGKLNYIFQEKMNFINRNGYRSRNLAPKDLPHNFISPLFFTDNRFYSLIPDDQINIMAIAALHHHGPLHKPESGLFKRQDKVRLMCINNYLSLDDGTNCLFPDVDLLRQFSNELDPMVIKQFLETKILKSNSVSDSKIIERRWIFSLAKQFLHLSDWTSSGATIGEIKAINLWEKTLKVLSMKRNKMTSLRKNLQDKMLSIGPRAIIVSPTGSGKTEAAVKWADQWRRSTFIFSLPTKSLVDDIYLHRFQGDKEKQGYFPDETGILHSTSDYVTESNYGDSPESHKYDRYLYRPVIVCTIDQILVSLYNIGKWDAVNFSLSVGSLVIDEVHTYDSFTTSLILELISQTTNVNTPILLMSATLPSWFGRMIYEITSQEFQMEIIHDNQDKLPWSIRTEHEIDIGEVVECSKRGNVLVVCNNVRLAQDLYNVIKNIHSNVRLLHGRFIQEHRIDQIKWAKEERKSGKILISTQIIEVGVDIDFDFLFTEIAPLDSIIQRAGRVNRNRDMKRESIVTVFETEGDYRDITEMIYEKKFLERTIQVLNEGLNSPEDLQIGVDRIYPEDESIQRIKDSYQELHKQILNVEKFEVNDGLHSISMKNSMFRISTRESAYVSVTVVPVGFMELANSANWKNYSINVPLKTYAKKITFRDTFNVVNLPYNSQTGLATPNKDDKENDFFI